VIHPLHHPQLRQMMHKTPFQLVNRGKQSHADISFSAHGQADGKRRKRHMQGHVALQSSWRCNDGA